MDDMMKEIGSRIRQARKSADLSQEQLAEMLDISTVYMSEIENGKTNFGLKTFMKITEVLQISADWLLQTNIPPVNKLLTSELNALFLDCTPEELRSYSRIVKEIKAMTYRS